MAVCSPLFSDHGPGGRLLSTGPFKLPRAESCLLDSLSPSSLFPRPDLSPPLGLPTEDVKPLPRSPGGPAAGTGRLRWPSRAPGAVP